MTKPTLSSRRLPVTRHFLAIPVFLCLFSLLLTACGGAASQDTTTQEEQTRTFKHAMGETKIPAHPQRVVVLDAGELDAALTLGITPVGAVSALQDGPFLSYFSTDKLKGITNVGTISQPNLDKILSLNPDLILSNKIRSNTIYSKLAEIAPTVLAENLGATWKENFILDADALGKKTEGEAILQKYYDRLKEFKQKVGEATLKNTKVSMVRVIPGQLRLYANGSYIGVILKDAGFSRPTAQDVNGKTFVTVSSYESIPQMDGDIIFLSQYGDSQAKLQELQNQPQWKLLAAVKNNKVFTVNDDYWATAIGMTSATLVVEDLFKYVAK
jgi:iron complex transport system substrate-binding protein